MDTLTCPLTSNWIARGLTDPVVASFCCDTLHHRYILRPALRLPQEDVTERTSSACLSCPSCSSRCCVVTATIHTHDGSESSSSQATVLMECLNGSGRKRRNRRSLCLCYKVHTYKQHRHRHMHTSIPTCQLRCGARSRTASAATSTSCACATPASTCVDEYLWDLQLSGAAQG
jgi:hypothetical protein